MNVDEIVGLIQSHHYANKPATLEDITAFNKRYNVELPDKMVDLYLRMNGARLFDKIDPSYELMPISAISPVSSIILGTEYVSDYSKYWFAFCDVRDGNYVAVDLNELPPKYGQVIDCFHESFPDPDYCGVIAASVCQFIESVLLSNGKLYWL